MNYTFHGTFGDAAMPRLDVNGRGKGRSTFRAESENRWVKWRYETAGNDISTYNDQCHEPHEGIRHAICPCDLGEGWPGNLGALTLIEAYGLTSVVHFVTIKGGICGGHFRGAIEGSCSDSCATSPPEFCKRGDGKRGFRV